MHFYVSDGVCGDVNNPTITTLHCSRTAQTVNVIRNFIKTFYNVTITEALAIQQCTGCIIHSIIPASQPAKTCQWQPMTQLNGLAFEPQQTNLVKCSDY